MLVDKDALNLLKEMFSAHSLKMLRRELWRCGGGMPAIAAATERLLALPPGEDKGETHDTTCSAAESVLIDCGSGLGASPAAPRSLVWTASQLCSHTISQPRRGAGGRAADVDVERRGMRLPPLLLRR